jgi:hypothetical protein
LFFDDTITPRCFGNNCLVIVEDDEDDLRGSYDLSFSLSSLTVFLFGMDDVVVVDTRFARKGLRRVVRGFLVVVEDKVNLGWNVCVVRKGFFTLAVVICCGLNTLSAVACVKNGFLLAAEFHSGFVVNGLLFDDVNGCTGGSRTKGVLLFSDGFALFSVTISVPAALFRMKFLLPPFALGNLTLPDADVLVDFLTKTIGTGAP